MLIEEEGSGRGEFLRLVASQPSLYPHGGKARWSLAMSVLSLHPHGKYHRDFAAMEESSMHRYLLNHFCRFPLSF